MLVKDENKNKKEFIERRIFIKNICWPACSHGVLNMKFGNKYYRGSGTLISSNIIITAAHNFYNEKLGLAHSIEFLAGANGKNCQAKSSISHFYFPEKYKEDCKFTDYKIFQNDYAIGILDKPLSTAVGHYGLSIIPEEKLKMITINVTGYPAEKPEKGANDYQLWGMKGNILKKDTFGLIHYEIDTEPGQSGSGIWYKDGNNFYVIAVHVFGSEKYNGGVLLTEERITTINKWINEHDKNSKANECKLPF